MKKITLLFFSLSLFCCSSDDTVSVSDQTAELLGKYRLVSLTSDIPLDLNLDGMATTDFKNELADFFDNYQPHFRIKESPDPYILDVTIPKSTFYPQYNDYDVSYIGREDIAYITYYKADNKLEFTRPYTEEYNLLYDMPIITAIEVLPDMKVKVTLKHRFYYHPDGWYNVILIGVYEMHD
jgi:hypothetical protein